MNRLKKSSCLIVVRARDLRDSRVTYEGCCTIAVMTSLEGEPENKDTYFMMINSVYLCMLLND